MTTANDTKLTTNKMSVKLLEEIWGPVRNPLIVVIPVTVIYVVIFVLGFFGNIITCVVVIRNKYMHTVTNFYLLSLAVSDLLLLVSGLPPEMYQIWYRYPYIFGEVFCILQGLAAETSANATVLTITAFTIERYVAICYPFSSRTSSKLRRAIRYIFLIWVLSFLFAIPQALKLGIVYGRDFQKNIIQELSVCSIKNNVVLYSFEISMLLFFILPMTVITVLYILIGNRLYKSGRVSSTVKRSSVFVTTAHDSTNNHQHIIQPDQPSNVTHIKSTKRVVKMLVAVVVAFFICWAPFQTQRLLAVYGYTGNSTSENMVLLFEIVTYVSGILYYFSAVINPILYNIMSNKFRRAFHDTMTMCLQNNSSITRRNSGDIGSSGGTRLNLARNNYPVRSINFHSSYHPSFEQIVNLNQRPIVIIFRKYGSSDNAFNATAHTIVNERSNLIHDSHCSSLPGIFTQRPDTKDANEVVQLRNYKYRFRSRHEAISYLDRSIFYSE